MSESICESRDKSILPCKYYEKKYHVCKLDRHGRCIDYIYNIKPILSYSYLENYCRCKRLFWYSYVMMYESLTPSINAILGNIAHSKTAYEHSTNPNINNMMKIMEREIGKLNKGKSDDDWSIPADVNKCIIFFNAYSKYEEDKVKKPKGKTELTVENKNLGVKCKYDLSFIDEADKSKRILEFKYTGSPDWYTFFTTEEQAGLYLMLDPEAVSITFRLLYKPKLKQGKNETETEFLERLERDILKKPGEYVIDKTFWRNEYDFNAIKMKIRIISDEIRERLPKGIDYFYQEKNGCMNPGICDYKGICESKCISDDMYRKSMRFNDKGELIKN